jgi:hypothetical protein
MCHHSLLALTDLLVLLKLMVHLVLEVNLEAKGLLESSSKLVKPTLVLGEGNFIVGSSSSSSSSVATPGSYLGCACCLINGPRTG